MTDDEPLPTIKPSDFPVKKAGAKTGINDRQRKAIAVEPRYEVWKLYVSGITTYRDIEELTGVPYVTVGRWIRGDIKRIASERDDLAENFLEVELIRLDKMLELLMRDVGSKLIDITKSTVLEGGMQGEKIGNRKDTYLLERVDVDIVDRILKVQERRAKYLALDKPRQAELKDDDGGFDLSELVRFAEILQQGKMPQEFIEADFTEEKDSSDGKEKDKDKGQEEEQETKGETESIE